MADDDASSAEMRRPPDPDQLAVDDDTLERLLTGGLPPAQAPSGYAEVARLLAAAVAAPHPSELAGQAAALEELRAVTRARAAAGGWRAARVDTRRRRRTGLAVVVVAGALAAGGVAGAATGHLPGPVREAARTILATVGGAEPPTPTPPHSARGRRRSPTAAPTGAGRPRPAPPPAAGSGSGGRRAGGRPGREGLCQALPRQRRRQGGNWTRPPSGRWPAPRVARTRSRPSARPSRPPTTSPSNPAPPRNPGGQTRPAAGATRGRAARARPRRRRDADRRAAGRPSRRRRGLCNAERALGAPSPRTRSRRRSGPWEDADAGSS